MPLNRWAISALGGNLRWLQGGGPGGFKVASRGRRVTNVVVRRGALGTTTPRLKQTKVVDVCERIPKGLRRGVAPDPIGGTECGVASPGFSV